MIVVAAWLLLIRIVVAAAIGLRLGLLLIIRLSVIGAAARRRITLVGRTAIRRIDVAVIGLLLRRLWLLYGAAAREVLRLRRQRDRLAGIRILRLGILLLIRLLLLIGLLLILLVGLRRLGARYCGVAARIARQGYRR